MSEDIGWKTDEVSRYRYSIAVCEELPWCWHGNWKCWFSNDSCPEPQRKRLVLSGCTVGFFYGLDLVFWWECRRCWLQSLVAATAVEFCCPKCLLQRRCVATVLSGMRLSGCGAGKEGHPGRVLALLLPVTKQDALGYLLLFNTPQMGCLKTIDVGGNPMFLSVEGLLYSFGCFPEMWPRAEIQNTNLFPS